MVLGVVERQRNKGLSGDKEDRVGVGVTGGIPAYQGIRGCSTSTYLNP
jgi:hypothetical protein